MKPSTSWPVIAILVGAALQASIGCGLEDAGAPSGGSQEKSSEKSKVEEEHKIVWGSTVDGWATRIWTKDDRSEFMVGKSIPIHFAIKNVGESAQFVVHRHFWRDHRLDVYLGDELAPLTKRGEKLRQAFNQPGPDEKVTSKELKPGEVDSTWSTIDLMAHYDLSKPAEYRVQVVHQARTLIPSNELTIEVTDR